ncbi:uncharacterized protein LOC129717981 [Wyeomyia smithii]|uniref:uncharacterized protein LOC129717981 n=1 Tax=Wyeomyia smithii TaxID=174621 RepID=UPI002467B1E2|nr:uncharacterized protein LOC129717981 [Wyeomyia smithii]XP_055524308.1 uncharacterized protein LOC129717981 [Wyeomyia smithii]XP_055524309.1 uncharacterized protein LOC129717981 [Wyeomyia smithii]XP_055524311.1 uncharacterized protein LOC129717981 [Wyeomyia smithii]
MIRISKATGAYAALVSVVSGTIMWFNFRPLGIFFFSGLVMFWCRQYANLRLQMTPLVEEKLRNMCQRALQLRTQKPSLFCGIVSCLLILLAIIGHVVSGACIVITLLVISIVVSTKYDIKIIVDREQVSSALSTNLLDQEVEEFLPEINDTNASLLRQIGDGADISALFKPESTNSEAKDGNIDDDADDDTYSDLLIPQNSIQELDEEQSNESSSDEFLLGSNGSRPVKVESCTEEIRFKSSHFNANTSSDSDDSISRGLRFDDVPDSSRKKSNFSHHNSQYELQQEHSDQQRTHHLPDQLPSLAGNLLASNMLNYISSAMTNASMMSQSQPAPSTRVQRYNRMSTSATGSSSRRTYDDSTDEDGDSDFEMLNPDELSNA